MARYYNEDANTDLAAATVHLMTWHVDEQTRMLDSQQLLIRLSEQTPQEWGSDLAIAVSQNPPNSVWQEVEPGYQGAMFQRAANERIFEALGTSVEATTAFLGALQAGAERDPRVAFEPNPQNGNLNRQLSLAWTNPNSDPDAVIALVTHFAPVLSQSQLVKVIATSGNNALNNVDADPQRLAGFPALVDRLNEAEIPVLTSAVEQINEILATTGHLIEEAVVESARRAEFARQAEQRASRAQTLARLVPPVSTPTETMAFVDIAQQVVADDAARGIPILIGGLTARVRKPFAHPSSIDAAEHLYDALEMAIGDESPLDRATVDTMRPSIEKAMTVLTQATLLESDGSETLLNQRLDDLRRHAQNYDFAFQTERAGGLGIHVPTARVESRIGNILDSQESQIVSAFLISESPNEMTFVMDVLPPTESIASVARRDINDFKPQSHSRYRTNSDVVFTHQQDVAGLVGLITAGVGLGSDLAGQISQTGRDAAFRGTMNARTHPGRPVHLAATDGNVAVDVDVPVNPQDRRSVQVHPNGSVSTGARGTWNISTANAADAAELRFSSTRVQITISSTDGQPLSPEFADDARGICETIRRHRAPELVDGLSQADGGYNYRLTLDQVDAIAPEVAQQARVAASGGISAIRATREQAPEVRGL